MKRLAIIQSSYIPWKGYFDMLDRVDDFVLYDDVQYTKNDWRNRNLIKTHNGTAWLTIPVLTKGRFGQLIQEAEINGDSRWADRHWKSIRSEYAGAEHFDSVGPLLEALYDELRDEPLLTRVNERFIREIARLLGSDTTIRRADEFDLPKDRIDRLIALAQAVGATEYLSGPAARSYLDEGRFEQAGIRVSWMSYDGYPEYPQLHGDFAHRVSIVDLLLNVGTTEARRYLQPQRPAGVEP
jgi:hypothetical protein